MFRFRPQAIKMSMLVKLLNKQFGPPFLSKDFVRAKRQTDGSVKLYIDRRDVHFDHKGKIVGASTFLLKPTPGGD